LSAGRRLLHPARQGVESSTGPRNDQQPTLTRHLLRSAVTPREPPHAGPWPRQKNSDRNRGSVDPG